jgi:hypothetical protein
LPELPKKRSDSPARGLSARHIFISEHPQIGARVREELLVSDPNASRSTIQTHINREHTKAYEALDSSALSEYEERAAENCRKKRACFEELESARQALRVGDRTQLSSEDQMKLFGE